MTFLTATAHPFFADEQKAIQETLYLSPVLLDPHVVLTATDLQILQSHAVNVTAEFVTAPYMNGNGPGECHTYI